MTAPIRKPIRTKGIHMSRAVTTVAGNRKHRTKPSVGHGILALSLVGAMVGCGDAAAGEAARRCSSEFADGLALVEGVPVDRRVSPALQVLGKGCPHWLGPLGEAALQASTLEREQRAQLLAKATVSELPAGCRAGAPIAPARDLALRCPPPPGEEIAPALLSHLDSGTYLFYLAAYRRLNEAQAVDFCALRILHNLLLAAALEGESAR